MLPFNKKVVQVIGLEPMMMTRCKRVAVAAVPHLPILDCLPIVGSLTIVKPASPFPWPASTVLIKVKNF